LDEARAAEAALKPGKSKPPLIGIDERRFFFMAAL
jgi:hypothetical protein